MTPDSGPRHHIEEALATAGRIIWRLARECRPDDVVIVGVATPIAAAAALLARELLVPELTVLVGPSVDPLVHDVALGLADPGGPARLALGTYRQRDVLDLIQRGGISLQFVSPAQVDGSGAINASRVRSGGPGGPERRLPGSLALSDTSALAGRLVAYRADHSPRFLVERVDFVTGRGRGISGDATGSRLGRGVVRVVTGAAVIGLGGRGPVLETVHRDADPADVIAACGFGLEVAPGGVAVTEEPPVEAVEVLDRVIDPHRIRLLETAAGRPVALDAWESLSR